MIFAKIESFKRQVAIISIVSSAFRQTNVQLNVLTPNNMYSNQQRATFAFPQTRSLGRSNKSKNRAHFDTQHLRFLDDLCGYIPHKVYIQLLLDRDTVKNLFGGPRSNRAFSSPRFCIRFLFRVLVVSVLLRLRVELPLCCDSFPLWHTLSLTVCVPFFRLLHFY